ncbi:unnamed protein product [Haemonchus placei]|uniref:G_PROTEIN_RECEP_F1_2 domain-containing protein n=1 Tax=Haemonchus placei TaxID=6290 RepID=A0A158QP97_HAEPC|nr:unnamed protein product [Haemonchus placei]
MINGNSLYFQALLLLYYPNILSRAVLFLYEFSIIMPEASFTHSWCSCAISMYLPSVIIERCFASKFVVDYEKIPRTWIISKSWISGIIISLGYMVSAIIAATVLLGKLLLNSSIPFANFENPTTVINNKAPTKIVSVIVHMFFNNSFISGYYNFVVLVVGFCVFMTICCLLYIALYRRDSARLRDMNRGVIAKNVIYTLSTRFQLTENLRVLKVNVVLLNRICPYRGFRYCILCILHPWRTSFPCARRNKVTRTLRARRSPLQSRDDITVPLSVRGANDSH